MVDNTLKTIDNNMYDTQTLEGAYVSYLMNEMESKESGSIQSNSIYEFRVIQCFDGDYSIELKAMLLYIKENKECLF